MRLVSGFILSHNSVFLGTAPSPDYTGQKWRITTGFPSWKVPFCSYVRVIGQKCRFAHRIYGKGNCSNNSRPPQLEAQRRAVIQLWDGSWGIAVSPAVVAATLKRGSRGIHRCMGSTWRLRTDACSRLAHGNTVFSALANTAWATFTGRLLPA